MKEGRAQQVSANPRNLASHPPPRAQGGSTKRNPQFWTPILLWCKLESPKVDPFFGSSQGSGNWVLRLPRESLCRISRRPGLIEDLSRLQQGICVCMNVNIGEAARFQEALHRLQGGCNCRKSMSQPLGLENGHVPTFWLLGF